jgi:hypothetical protein
MEEGEHGEVICEKGNSLDVESVGIYLKNINVIKHDKI